MARTETLICENCPWKGEIEYELRGSTWITILLFLLGIVPGLIYMAWRRSGHRHLCPQCGSPNVFPIDSPRGQEIASWRSH